MLISNSLANADAITAAAEAGTIVIQYDAARTTASELIDIINQSLEGKAHSIGFVTDADASSSLHLFADEDTSGSTASDKLQKEFWQAVEEHLNENGQVKLFAAHLLSTTEGEELVDTIRNSLEHSLDVSEDTSEAVEQDSDWLLDFSEDDMDPLIEVDLTGDLEETEDIEDEEDLPAAGITEIDISGDVKQAGDIVEATETVSGDGTSSNMENSFDHTDIVAGPVSFSAPPAGFSIAGNVSAPVSALAAMPPAANTTSVESDLNGNVNLYMQGYPHFTPFYYSTLDVNEISAFHIGRYPFFEPTQYFYPQTLVSVGEEDYDEFEFRFTVNPLTNPLYGQVPPLGALPGFEITPNAPLSLTADFPVYGEVNGEYTIGSGWLVIYEPAGSFNVNQYQQPLTVGQIDQFYLDFSDRTTLFEKADPFLDSIDKALNKLIGR